MTDCNGYSLPARVKPRSNFMAAYPAGQSLILDRGQGASFRDYNVYGTYPRNTWGSNDQDIRVESEVLNNQKNNDSNTLRSILRNRHEYTPVNSVNHIMDESCDSIIEEGSENGLPIAGKFAGNLAFFDSYLRPIVAEFLSVLFAVFAATLVEATLQELLIVRVFRIGIVSVIDGICALVCIGTFQSVHRVHLNPAITLGALFGGDTKPILCAMLWVTQIVGSTLGVFLYQIVTINGPPVIPALLHSDQFLTSMYKLVLCQTIACAMLVMTYLSHQRTTTTNATDSLDVFAISAAVILTSFVSLLCSTVSWNPAKSLGTCIAATLQWGAVKNYIWTTHYVFWLGPIIGSLFASFFYRLVFAQEKQRIVSCCVRNRNSSTS